MELNVHGQYVPKRSLVPNHYQLQGVSSPFQKWILIMKLTTVLILIGVLQVSANTFSQNVSITASNISLPKVFKQIESQTNLAFIYEKDLIKKLPNINIDVRNVPVEEVLGYCFKENRIVFSKKGNFIILKPAPLTGGVNHRLSPVLEIPPITVRGRIVNENGEPVVASVMIKGTSKGTTSNANGEFELNNVDEDAELIITSASTETTIVKLNKRNLISISVKSSVNDLDAVVVNKGYYSESQKLSTGNVSKVDAKTIEKQPISNPLQAIQGRMAGVYVQQVSGVPGSEFKIQIRGQNSLRPDGNAPLYIVDGVPFTSSSISTSDVADGINLFSSPLNNINPSDIESIEILKDADATAIYGSRGANGVVLINTKREKAGTTQFDFNVNKGAGKVTRTIDLLNSAQWVEMRKEGFANDNRAMTNGNAPDLLLWDTTRYTDWQKVLTGGAADYTNAQASLSGGTANTRFLFGGNFFTEGTVYPGDFRYKRGSGHFNLNHSSVDKRLQFSLSVSYLVSDNNLPAEDLAVYAISLAPVAPAIYDNSGNLNWENSTWDNPFGIMRRRYTSKNNNLVTSASLSYEIIKGLFIKNNWGYNSLAVKERRLNTIASYNPVNNYSASTAVGTSSINTWIVEPQLEYSKQLGHFKLSALAGGTLQHSNRDGLSLFSGNIQSDAQLDNIQAGDVSIYYDRKIQYKYAAIFGRVNLNWQDKYLINLTGRRDGSSRFGPNKRFSDFGAAGAAWLFYNERVIRNNLSFLSFGKLRLSYGTTGSDQIPDYQYFDTYTSTNGPYDNINGLIPTRLTNPDFSWESNKKWEAGLELGFFQNKISFSTSFYRNRSSNQLVGYPLPGVTGQNEIQYNLDATVQNTGIELVVKTKNFSSKNLTWESWINFTAPKNKLIRFPNLEGSSYASAYVIGQPLSIKRLFSSLGVDPAIGLYAFQDFNGNNYSMDIPGDVQTYKNVGQQFFGGVGNSVRFSNFQLDLFFQFVKQTAKSYLSSFVVPGFRNSNQPVWVMNRWRRPGDVSEVQRFASGVNDVYFTYSAARIADQSVVDASFIRLKNVSLSWRLPDGLTQKLHLKGFRIYIQGQNVFTITDYKGLDPETQNAASLPPLKTLTAGLEITL